MHCLLRIFLFLILIPVLTYGQQVKINEIMSSNSTTCADEDGDYSDWIELYNPGDNPVQLEGWYLSDNKSNPAKWAFPKATLSPKQFLQVWASGKNYRPADGDKVPGVIREVYTGISGSDIRSLTQNPAFPGSPSSRQRIKARFEAPVNVSSNYGQHMYGFIMAPETGNYNFWISSDDNGQLWLSTDESPLNVRLIAEVPGWTNSREWSKYTSQQSASIFLEKGKYYYISALMKEGTGGDNLAVGWQLPDGTPDFPVSGQYLSWPGGELHTSFNISASGEEILLTNPQKTVADQFSPVSLKSGISYGRVPDGGTALKFFNLPTPGKANTSAGYSGILSAPLFSKSGGFYKEQFSLTLSASQPGASVIYTLDGSDPDMNHLAGVSYPYLNQYRQNPNTGAGPMLYRNYATSLYSGPILIRDRSSDPNQISRISTTYDANPWYFPSFPLDKAVVVRARSVREGALASDVVTQTYFVTSQGANPYRLPVISFVAQEDALFDFYKGIYVAGSDFENWRSANPSAKPDGGTTANYHREGDDWEYPASFEYFDPDGIRMIDQNVGFRMHGNYSNSNPFKSLRIYARSEYGSEYLGYPFFTNRNDSTFKRIILRNSGNDIWYTMFRDAAMQEMVSHLDFETQAYQPSVLFINGEYWGIHNIRERYDKYYLAARFGINPEQVDILENNMSVDEGENSHYARMVDYISQYGLKQESNYAYVKTLMDPDCFRDYMIAQIFMVNADWPGNNIKYWRLQTPEYLPDAPPGNDGRWRWMLYDADFTFGIYTPTDYSKNMMTFVTQTNGPAWPNPEWSTFLFRKLLENEEFKTSFIIRFSDELNTAFRSDVIKSMINKMQVVIEPEMNRHIQRWKMPSSLSTWYSNVNQMRSFADLRPDYARNHLRQFFNLSSDYLLTVDVSGPEQGYVVVNTISLRNGTRGVPVAPYPWQGIYFRNLPLRLEAVPAQGYEFVKWTGTEQVSYQPVLELSPAGNLSMTAVFRESEPKTLYPPAITQPLAGAMVDRAVTILWTPVTGASKYELQIAVNNSFLNPFLSFDNITSGSFEVTLPDSDTGYFVRVRAVGSSGQSDWSEIVTFRKGTTPVVSYQNREENLFVYPNPFRESATADLHLLISGNVRIALCTLSGEEFQEIFNGYLAAGTYSFMIDGNRISRSVCFLLCRTSSGIFRKKLVKQ